MNRYRLIPTESKEISIDGLTIKVYRIMYVRRGENGTYVDVGKGGWLQSDYNLPHNSGGRVVDDGVVCGSAIVDGRALIQNNAIVYGSVHVTNDAMVSNDAKIIVPRGLPCTVVFGGNAALTNEMILDKPIPIVTRSDGYTFVMCLDDSGKYRIRAGCRYYTIKEAFDHWFSTEYRKRNNPSLYMETLDILNLLIRFHDRVKWTKRFNKLYRRHRV